VAPTQGTSTDLARLQAQVVDLRIQLTGLQAQWKGLRVQLDNMLQNNPARPGVQQKWADVGVQIAQVQGDIARIDAQVAQLRGVPVGTTSQPPGPLSRRIDPNVAIPAAAVLFMVLGLPVSIAWAKRLMRGEPRRPAPPLIDPTRLERIEHAVEAMAIEVERIGEGQRFMTKILAERPRESTPEVAEAAPLRALGAGPIEPIRIAERERVSQRNP
jgi:hypothetical protein